MQTLPCPDDTAAPSGPIRVAIADDHPITRRALRTFLDDQEGIRVVGEARSGREAIGLVRAQAPDVLLLDVDMRDQSGVDALPAIRAQAAGRGTRLAVLVFSGYPEESYALPFLRNGAHGYLGKSCAPAELAAAIRQVASGGRYITAKVAELLARQVVSEQSVPLHEQLSARELQLLIKFAKGRKPAEIAGEVCLSPKTVSRYRTQLMRKFRARSASELTCYAVRHCLMD